MNYTFCAAAEGDTEKIFKLYTERVAWMDRKGIRQWNVTDYFNAYPLPYFKVQARGGNLFILRADNDIAGAVVLLKSDKRWNGAPEKSAYYIHNLVTACSEKGCGKIILAEIERLAAVNGIKCLRLDCAENNLFLIGYYESLGYLKAGKFREGNYNGIKLEKILD